MATDKQHETKRARKARGTRPPCICACGDHAFANLTKGFVTLVSPEDVWMLSTLWYADVACGIPYARRTAPGKERKHLHREILGMAPDGPLVDHRSGDTLDNRRSNLREATDADNARNTRARKSSTSRFLGVSWRKREQAWVAQIQCQGKGRHIGNFASEEDAARAYDAAAIEMHGEFARPNFPAAYLRERCEIKLQDEDRA